MLGNVGGKSGEVLPFYRVVDNRGGFGMGGAGAFCGRLMVECSQDWWRLLVVWWLAPLIPRELAPVSWFVLLRSASSRE